MTVRQRYVERWKRCAMANGASPFTSPMRIALPISSKRLLNGRTRLPWCNCTQLHEGNGLLLQIVRDLLLQPLAEASGKFKRFAVADQPDRIRGAFQDGSAVLAGFEVALETRGGPRCRYRYSWRPRARLPDSLFPPPALPRFYPFPNLTRWLDQVVPGTALPARSQGCTAANCHRCMDACASLPVPSNGAEERAIRTCKA